MWENLKLSYTEVAGNRKLRGEIAKIHEVTPEQVNVVVPQEGIYIAMNCLVHLINKSEIHTNTSRQVNLVVINFL